MNTRRLLASTGSIVLGVAGLVLASGAPGGATTHPLSTYVCQGSQRTLFDNTNGLEVANGGGLPTFSTHGKAYCVTYIQTYHWNNGKGSYPGHLSLIRVSGPPGLPKHTHFFPAKGSPGQNNVVNANAYADVPTNRPTIIDGVYHCSDTVRATWSANKQSAGAGFCIVYGDPAVPPS